MHGHNLFMVTKLRRLRTRPTVLIESQAMKSLTEKKGGLTRKTKAALSWAIVVALLVLIFWMSNTSGSDLNNNSGIVSIVKNWLSTCALAIFGHEVDVSPVGHFSEYLALGAALANALRFTPWTRFNDRSDDEPHAAGMLGSFPVPLAATFLCSLYGVTDEFHQIFTPNRSCDPADWLVDTCAAAIGAAIIWAILRKRSKKKAC